jgi:hypothetical protein
MGPSATDSILAEEGRITLRKFLKYRRRKYELETEISRSKIELDQLHKAKSEHIHNVASPLVLISQIQRSGGSLLSQLFDGHPEIHPHPHELMLGYKKKHVWPRIDLHEHPSRWFVILFEKMVVKHAKEGYKKGREDKESFPFTFSPFLQQKVFLDYIESAEQVNLRTVFDAYMTSYFGAWLNNQNYDGEKKCVTAFTPRLSMNPESTETFFNIYPDGRMISLIRDPRNWYPSALRHGPKVYGDFKGAISQWIDSAQAMLRNKKRYKNRICLITFEDLISKTDLVMRYLSEFAEIEFDEILLEPTFNKLPIKAHTSFKSEHHGILNSTLSRYKTLTDSELQIIEEMTSDTYSQVLNVVINF